MGRGRYLFLLVLLTSPNADAGRIRPGKPAFVRPTTVKLLQQRGLEALANNDPEAFLRLLLTYNDMKKYCPHASSVQSVDEFKKRLKRLRDGVRRRVAQCAKLFDWKRAKIVSISGGKMRAKIKICSGVGKLEDIEVIYAVDGKRYLVELDDPMRFGRTRSQCIFKLTDDPRCEEVKNSSHTLPTSRPSRTP